MCVWLFGGADSICARSMRVFCGCSGKAKVTLTHAKAIPTQASRTRTSLPHSLFLRALLTLVIVVVLSLLTLVIVVVLSLLDVESSTKFLLRELPILIGV